MCREWISVKKAKPDTDRSVIVFGKDDEGNDRMDIGALGVLAKVLRVEPGELIGRAA